MSFTDKQIYYRLIALWAVCEGMLGGIIHGFKLPVSGLIVGSSAVIIICLIACYVPAKGSIIKATIIVAIFKMMLSPQSPLPAYFAVFFQGIVGELFFLNRKYYKTSCIAFASIALVESGIQRIIVMTLIYGTSFWKAVNDFINGLTHQQTITNYSLYLAGGYVALHLVVGIFVGWLASRIPLRVKGWRNEFQLELKEDSEVAALQQLPSKKKRKLKIGLLVVWIVLIALWAQSEFKIGAPLLSSNVALHILIRSLLILLTWYFLVSPLLTFLLKKFLMNQKAKSQSTINEILLLIPSTQLLLEKSWQSSASERGLKRLSRFLKTVLSSLNGVYSERKEIVQGETSGGMMIERKIFILSGPIHSGKTTRLIHWMQNRNDVSGILSPVINGQRYFMNAATKETFPMEASPEEQNVLPIGKYVFSASAFGRAKQILRNALNQNEGWLIIDEVGPLELKEQGFHDVLKEILNQQNNNLKIILVIREALIDAVVKFFGIENYEKLEL